MAPRQKTRQNGSQLNLEIEQAKAAKERPKDDLSKIHGIGPVFARTLNKMGLYSFGQIARWTSEDIDKVAKKLYTAPDRIKSGTSGSTKLKNSTRRNTARDSSPRVTKRDQRIFHLHQAGTGVG